MSAPALRAQRLAAYRVGRIQHLARSFQTSSVRRAGNETAEANEARKQEIERAKQEQLQQQKEGKNEWKQTLASESESITKADRGEMNASKQSIKELQEESAAAAQKEKK